MAMKLSTGKVAFPIEFDNGDKAVIYFNPNDPDLMIRIKNFNENVSKKIAELSVEAKAGARELRTNIRKHIEDKAPCA